MTRSHGHSSRLQAIPNLKMTGWEFERIEMILDWEVDNEKTTSLSNTNR